MSTSGPSVCLGKRRRTGRKLAPMAEDDDSAVDTVMYQSLDIDNTRQKMLVPVWLDKIHKVGPLVPDPNPDPDDAQLALLTPGNAYFARLEQTYTADITRSLVTLYFDLRTTHDLPHLSQHRNASITSFLSYPSLFPAFATCFSRRQSTLSIYSLFWIFGLQYYILLVIPLVTHCFPLFLKVALLRVTFVYKRVLYLT